MDAAKNKMRDLMYFDSIVERGWHEEVSPHFLLSPRAFITSINAINDERSKEHDTDRHHLRDQRRGVRYR